MSLLTTSSKLRMHPHYLFPLAIFLLLTHSHGAPPPLEAVEEFLEAHNAARAAVGVKPLAWSEKLANASSLMVRFQRNKMSCQFANLTASKYGGNQLWAGSAAAVSPRKAVEEWVKEKQFYNHTSNTCSPGHECGVYTQVVWGDTAELGCSQASCVKDNASLTICFYDPPGNVVGQSPYSLNA